MNRESVFNPVYLWPSRHHVDIHGKSSSPRHDPPPLAPALHPLGAGAHCDTSALPVLEKSTLCVCKASLNLGVIATGQSPGSMLLTGNGILQSKIFRLAWHHYDMMIMDGCHSDQKKETRICRLHNIRTEDLCPYRPGERIG